MHPPIFSKKLQGELPKFLNNFLSLGYLFSSSFIGALSED